MKNRLGFFVVSLFALSAYPQSTGPTPGAPKNTAFTNVSWFNGHSFHRRNAYAVDGVLSFRRPSRLDAVLDLGGGFVVPPLGEAHNHNVEPLNKVDPLIQRYIHHGIFYVKNPDNLPTGRDQVLPKIDRPDSIDVTFSNGGFTGEGGHPAEIVKRNIDRHVWTEADGDGAFYYSLE